MSKREAETYLTDRNWDEEEEEEQPGVFATASEEVIKNRPILKAKRRCGSRGTGNTTNIFQGFSFTGLTGTAAVGKSPEKPLTSEPVHPETMVALNKNFVSLIQEHIAKDAECDLSPLFVDYCQRAKLLASAAKAPAVPLSQLFSKAPDTWDCSVCFVNNKNTDAVCVSCTSPKPAQKLESDKVLPVSVESETVVAASSDQSKPSLADLFKKSGGEWDCSECFVRNKSECTKCVACDTVKPSGGMPAQTSVTMVTSSTSSGMQSSSDSFVFGNSGGFSFKPAASTGDGNAPKLTFGFTPGGVVPNFRFNMPASAAAGGETTGDATASTSQFGFQFGSGSSTALSVASAGQGFSFKLPESTDANNSLASGFSSQGFIFKPPVTSSTEPTSGEGGDDEEYVPPKAEAVQHTEQDAFYTVKCKLFYKKDDSWQDRGVGNLFLKPCDKKTQLLIRTDTSIGNILLNVLLSSNTPISRQGTNNVSLVCIQNPPLDTSSGTKSKVPVCMLIRVKTSDMADELFKQLLDCKAKSAAE
jgi:hypothetical protein